jgi:branched-chain amino acid transport system substrate-binding protein
MSARVKRLLYLAVALAVGVVIAGCGSNDGSAGAGSSGGSDEGPIVIGMSASKTGPYSVDGKVSLEGNEYAIHAMNESGGWLGRKLELKVYDDQSDPTKTQQIYQRLITQDKVDFIIGPYAPDLAAAAGAVATRYQYVMLDPETALPIISGSKWAIMDEPAAKQNLDGYPSIVAEAGLKTLAVLGVNNAYGDECAQGVKDEAQEEGVEIAYTTSYSPDDNLSSAAEAIKARGADAVASCSFFSDGVALTRALDRANYTPKMFALTIGPSKPEFADAVGKLANRIISNTSWAPSLDTEGNAEFVKGFTEVMGHAPDYHAANNFQSMQVLAAAVADTKSLDQKTILDKLYSTEYETVIGTFKLSPDAVAIGFKEYLYQVQDDSKKQKLIYPPDVAEAKVITPYKGS